MDFIYPNICYVAYICSQAELKKNYYDDEPDNFMTFLNESFYHQHEFNEFLLEVTILFFDTQGIWTVLMLVTSTVFC